MSANPRRDGATWELTLLRFFRDTLGLRTEHIRKTGKHDQGDHAVEDDDTDTIFIVEAKNEKSIDLAGYVRQASVEADNYARARGVARDRLVPVVVVKRRNHSVLDAYVVLRVRDFFGES